MITKNKKAYFDYEILDNWEAGIELFWHEVKSIRAGHVNLKWSYVSFIGWHNFVKGLHITPWISAWVHQNIASERERKILLHKKTIEYLSKKQKEWWFSIIPLEIYLKWSLIKLKVWLCKWKKEYDKKQILKERSIDKEAKIMMKKFNI
jgi:SsrA-binding protein